VWAPHLDHNRCAWLRDPARLTHGGGHPHREKYLLLVAGFMRRYFELHLDLVDEVERELGPARGIAREPL
jgi:hypothetical protein